MKLEEKVVAILVVAAIATYGGLAAVTLLT